MRRSSLPGRGWYILNATPITVAQAGGLADVPVLTGYNAAEGTVPLDAAITAEELSSKLGKLYGNQAEAARKLYNVTAGDASQAAQQHGHDRVMMGAFTWAAALVHECPDSLTLAGGVSSSHAVQASCCSPSPHTAGPLSRHKLAGLRSGPAPPR